METNSRSQLTLTRGRSLYPRTNAVSFCWEIEDSFHCTVKTLFKCSLSLVEIRAPMSELSGRAGRLCHSALGQVITHRPLSPFFWVTDLSY